MVPETQNTVKYRLFLAGTLNFGETGIAQSFLSSSHTFGSILHRFIVFVVTLLLESFYRTQSPSVGSEVPTPSLASIEGGADGAGVGRHLQIQHWQL